MSKKKKRIQKGWLCPECSTVYAPTVKKCECLKETAAVVDVIEGDDGELHLDWNVPMGLKIGWGQLDATITDTSYNGVTSWVTLPPRDPNQPIYIYGAGDVGCGI